jgi:uncharacterized protein (TIGR00725 family)
MIAGTAVERRPIVGVMGSGIEPHAARARALGRWLASEGVHLLTGGGGGVMAAVGEAFCAVPGRAGRALAVLPGVVGEAGRRAPEGYPNAWVEIPIFTHLPLRGAHGDEPLSRNHVNVLSSDVVVALPGGPGTASEVRLALRYGRPLVAWLDDRAQIAGLPEAARVEGSFAGVCRFVREALARAWSREP